MRTRVTSQAPSIIVTDWSASETVTVEGKEIQEFAFKKQARQSVRDALGSGRKVVVTGEGAGLRKDVTITAYESFPSTLVFQVRDTNTSGSPITIDRWTNQAYVIPSREQVETPFWSFQSGSYQNRPSWVFR